MLENSEEYNIVDILLDSDNNENIILFDEDENEIEFEQAAVVKYQDKVYAVLIPLDGETEEDEGVVFEILEAEGDIEMVEDDDLAEVVIALCNEQVEGV